VHKLGVPGNEQYDFGAVGEGGVRLGDLATLPMIGMSDELVEEIAAREGEELARQVAAYRGSRPPARIEDRAAVLVDDGIGTGGTIRAAIAVARQRGASRVLVAADVAPAGVVRSLSHEADAAVAAIIPEPMMAVGQWYDDFTQATDAEARAALARRRHRRLNSWRAGVRGRRTPGPHLG